MCWYYWYSQEEPLIKALLMKGISDDYQQHMFLWRNKKNISIFWLCFNWRYDYILYKKQMTAEQRQYHYENMRIQILWKFYHQKMKIFR